jgi:hypothetical protein
VYYVSAYNQIVSLTNQKHILGKVPTWCHGFLGDKTYTYICTFMYIYRYNTHVCNLIALIYTYRDYEAQHDVSLYAHICTYIYTYRYSTHHSMDIPIVIIKPSMMYSYSEYDGISQSTVLKSQGNVGSILYIHIYIYMYIAYTR